MSSIAPKSFSMSMTTRGREPEQNVLQVDLEAGKGVKRLKDQRIKVSQVDLGAGNQVEHLEDPQIRVISTGVLQLGSSSGQGGQGGSDHYTQGDVRDPGTTNQLGEVKSTGVLQLGSSSGQGGSDHDMQGDVCDPGTTNQLGEGGSRTGQRDPNHDAEEGVVDPEAGNQLEEDPSTADNHDEDRKTALKISLFVYGVTCGGIYSIFSGLLGNKGQYHKPLVMACTLLMMVTMLSSVVLMGIAFTGSSKEWLIRILNRAKYIPLVLLILTGLIVGITFLLSLK